MIKAAIYDLDGLIIDSEPIWQDAEIEIFAKYGVNITREMCKQTMGLRIDEAIAHWDNEIGFNSVDRENLKYEVIDKVALLISERGKALPGVVNSLERIYQSDLLIAIASSSYMKIINATIDKLEIRHYFDLIYSAEYEDYGKPHPGIFLNTAKQLGVKPFECIVFEDSANGVIAALAARMKVVAVPDKSFKNEKIFAAAHFLFDSMDAIDDKFISSL